MSKRKTVWQIHNEAIKALFAHFGTMSLVSLALSGVAVALGLAEFIVMVVVKAFAGINFQSIVQLVQAGSFQEFWAMAQPLLEALGINLLIGAVLGVFTGILQTASTIGGYDASLRVLAGERAALGPIARNFRRGFWRFAGVTAWVALWQFLWSLLFLVPGIVKSYSYRLAPFLALRHPELTVRQALLKSIEITEGHKASLFALDLILMLYQLAALLASLLVPVLGSLAVRLLLVAPMTLLVFSVAYRDIGREAVEKGLLTAERG